MLMDLKDKEQQRRWKNHNFCQSLRHALTGLKTVWLDERNFRFDTAAMMVAILLGVCLKLSLYEWLWICWSIISVLANEIWNTVIENVVDLVTKFHSDPLAKKAKDMASAAVLLNAIFALLVGVTIFGIKIWQLFIR
ncbi:diacylglycerol kinase family protein [Liquorilactobacillus vini]|nr:diacylglycerol kinase family protein [Liquorilactobacillus vini]